MLEVVQHQQQFAAAERVEETRREHLVVQIVDAKRGGDRCRDERRAWERAEIDKGRAVSERRLEFSGGREREPSLADPAGAGQGGQPRLGIEQQRAEPAHLVGAAHEARRRRRQRPRHST